MNLPVRIALRIAGVVFCSSQVIAGGNVSSQDQSELARKCLDSIEETVIAARFGRECRVLVRYIATTNKQSDLSDLVVLAVTEVQRINQLDYAYYAAAGQKLVMNLCEHSRECDFNRLRNPITAGRTAACNDISSYVKIEAMSGFLAYLAHYIAGNPDVVLNDDFQRMEREIQICQKRIESTLEWLLE